MKHGLASEFLDQSNLLGEAWVAGFDTGRVFDKGSALCKETQNSGGHGDPMVSMAFHLCPDDGATAFNQKAVRLLFHGDSEKAKIFCDDGQSVALLVPEFARILNFCCALG
jgi:hypothetical protein